MVSALRLRSPVVLAAVTLLLAATAASATVIHVPGEQPTVAAGIGAASPGDTVEIACDTYYEHGLTVSKGITITSETGDPSCVTIDGEEGGRIMWVEAADGLVVCGITFTLGEDYFGAAVLVDTADVTFANCVFTGNYASYEGAGVFYNVGTATFTDCAFPCNHAGNSGGGIVLNGAGGTVTDCTFTDNLARWGGGAAVYHSGATPTFEGCRFEGNDVVGGDSYGGGAYAWDQASPTFHGCTFVGNTSEYCGGGFCSDEQCAATVQYCTFEGNSAQWGGGVYVWEAAGGSVLQCDLIGNTATSGGGVLYEGVDDMDVFGCKFFDNTSSLGGGGLAMDDCGCEVWLSVFSGNTAQYGGAVGLYDCTDVMIGACDIVLNTATDPARYGGAIGVFAGTPLTLDTSIVAFNSGGPVVVCEDGGAVEAVACCIHGNDSDWVDCLAGQESQNNNVDLDPLFCDVLGGDLTLCENSPCLPEHNPAELLIGINGAGCGPCDSPVEVRSWGAIKAMFRTGR